MIEKIKHILANNLIYNSLLIILVGLFSFLLGRWSVIDNNLDKQPNQTVRFSPAPDSLIVSDTGDRVVVASKSGERYHLPECSGAKRIKESNRISFPNVLAAEAAGYTPAKNCPGLQVDN